MTFQFVMFVVGAFALASLAMWGLSYLLPPARVSSTPEPYEAKQQPITHVSCRLCGSVVAVGLTRAIVTAHGRTEFECRDRMHCADMEGFAA